MRFHFILCVALCSLGSLLASGCSAENPAGGQQEKALTAAETASVAKTTDAKSAAPLGKAKKPTSALLGSPKKPTSAPLGRAKPKFALKNKTPMASNVGANAQDRTAEVKRLIDAYQGIAIRYSDGLVRASTPEEIEALAPHAPSARALRSIVVLIADLVAADPKDAAALDALVFLCKFIGVPEIDVALVGKPSDETSDKAESGKAESGKVDPIALLLEHHADNPKIVSALRRLPRGDAADAFLQTLFNKTYNPNVRWSAGAQLISSLRRNSRPQEMTEKVVITMSEDRYLEGVPVGRETNAREWAVNKLREIRTLGIGKLLPEVFGNKLEGSVGNITDYRGKVVVLDVWTTWCGPCHAMIPHEVEMVERLKDKPFVLLSVSCDRDQETLEKFLEGTSMPWDHWWVAPDSEFKKTLNISSFPTIYVLDGKGVIRHKNIKDEQLEEVVDALLKEMEEPAASQN
jgi:thiol-disulfide isomerase/thioredoxin